MKMLSPTIHGYLDYATVLVFLFAPTLLGLTGLPALLAYVLAVVHLVMTLVTKFPLGAVKLVPFPLHGWVERIVGPVLVVLGFVPGFTSDTKAQIFYVAAGAVIILVGLITDYRATSS